MVQTPVRKLTFEEYLAFDDGTDTRYELVNGALVPMNPPRGIHARIARFLYAVLLREIDRLHASLVVDWSHGVRTTVNKACLPDLVVMTQAQEASLLDVSAVLDEAPPLVIEIVSPDRPTRDYRAKRAEYAARDIPEYWIIDPQKAQMMVLTLVDGAYDEVVLREGDRLQSTLFPELTVSVAQILAGRP